MAFSASTDAAGEVVAATYGREKPVSLSVPIRLSSDPARIRQQHQHSGAVGLRRGAARLRAQFTPTQGRGCRWLCRAAATERGALAAGEVLGWRPPRSARPGRHGEATKGIVATLGLPSLLA